MSMIRKEMWQRNSKTIEAVQTGGNEALNQTGKMEEYPEGNSGIY